ncbi:MAG: FAD-dependent oxidoreductase, partial [Rubrivivax sp.]
AGVIAPGYVTPWAAPGMPAKVLRHLFSRHAPVRLGSLGGVLREAPWLWRWWRACQPGVHAANRTRMHRLARYSRHQLDGLTARLRLDYERSSGYLVLLRGDADLALARPGIKQLSELGVPFALLDADRARQIEPGLSDETALRAAIHLAQDGVGNCRQFAHLLRQEAQQLGAQFRFDDAVRALRPGTTVEIDADRGALTVDAVVVCAGPQAGALLRPIGLKLPLARVWGYSLTAPLRHVDGHGMLGPRSALMDERFKVAISRLGQRVRVAGSAEIGGRSGHFDPKALATLYRVLHDWFPGATQIANAQRWKGARPMLPDGPPVLGASGRPGIWLNLGHGSSGWALAAGSARVLADQLAGRAPAIDTEGLGIDRLERRR